MKLRPATTLLALVFLFLAAHRLPAPIREESTPAPARPKAETKTAAKAKSSPAAESGMRSHSVQVVLSENTRASLMHLRTYVETVEKIPFAPKSDVKPDDVLERLRQVLSSRFGNVSILNDGSGSHSGDGLVMVFDLHAQVGMRSGEKNTVSMSGNFRDGGGKVIQTITGAGSTTVPYPAWRTHFPEALAAAFSEFSQKLSTAR